MYEDWTQNCDPKIQENILYMIHPNTLSPATSFIAMCRPLHSYKHN